VLISRKREHINVANILENKWNELSVQSCSGIVVTGINCYRNYGYNIIVPGIIMVPGIDYYSRNYFYAGTMSTN